MKDGWLSKALLRAQEAVRVRTDHSIFGRKQNFFKSFV